MSWRPVEVDQGSFLCEWKSVQNYRGLWTPKILCLLVGHIPIYTTGFDWMFCNRCGKRWTTNGKPLW